LKTKTPTQPHYFIPQPLDNTRLAHLCGPLDENLRQISAALDVSIFRRGDKFIAAGSNAERAVEILDQFYAVANKVVSVDEIQLALVEQRAKLGMGKKLKAAKSNGNADAESASGKEASADPADAELTETDIESPVLKTRRSDLRGRTPHQSQYIRSILEHDVTLGIGPAGTGKTYLAVACAVDALERDAVKRIVLTRPAVEAGERLGFLPGDLAQKVDPYLRPLYDALYDLLGFDRTQKMFEKQAIEIAPLAYMRGRTLNHAFIILDEAQNTTPEQMKMFLTRIGFGSKAVVTGDVTQIDLQRGQKSGLIDAMNILKDVRGIAFTRFNSSDVVRHPLVARIVDAYESASLAAPVASTHGIIESATPQPAKTDRAAKPVSTGITKTARNRNAAKK
jgi:phosphate starvation-inducible protein PhoH and related proteins